MNNPGIPFRRDHPLLGWQQEMAHLPGMPGPLAPTSENIHFLIRCLDLTSLKATDTPETINRLLEQAVHPAGAGDAQVAAVCVYQPFVRQAREFLVDTAIDVATVAGGFPHGQLATDLKVAEVSRCVELGANEVDIVINRTWPLTDQWEFLNEEVKACKEACGSARLKVILATGELHEPRLIYKSAMVSMMAGADFVKTSTGMEAVNATLEAGFYMMKAIKAYFDQTGGRVGLKPAGGIRQTGEALQWLALLQDQLGEDWMKPAYFRIGASSLLNDLVKHL
jgi:deoxyribose-phosphate aldolase